MLFVPVGLSEYQNYEQFVIIAATISQLLQLNNYLLLNLIVLINSSRLPHGCLVSTGWA